jgi:ABC-2 type transport system permease protein
MVQIIQIIKKEFLQLRRDRRMFPIIFIAPILQLILLGYAATLDIKNLSLAVCDLDRTTLSRELVQGFTGSRYFSTVYAVNVPSEIDPLIDKNTVNLALVIPYDFARSIRIGESRAVQVLVDGSDANTANISLSYAQRIINRFTQAHLQNNLPVEIATVNPIDARQRVWYNAEIRSANFMVPGVVCLVLMVITIALAAMAIVKEKEIGTLEQLIVTPIRPYQLIIGKLAPFTIIGYIIITIVVALAHYWFRVPFEGSLLLLYFLTFGYLLSTLGLALFISTVSRTQQQAMFTAVFFVVLPFMYLSGFVFPIENMPRIIQYVTYLIPLRYFIEIVRGIFLKGNTFAILLPRFLIMLTFGIVIMSFSILRFRKKLE